MAAKNKILEVNHLEPFVHQVGGQLSILQLDDATICKPLILQECNFYTSIPDVLKQFVPDYKGDIEVCFAKDNEGYFTLTTNHLSDRFPSTSKTGMLGSSALSLTSDKIKCRIRVDTVGSIGVVSNVNHEKQLFEENDNRCISHNPWVLRCLQKQFKRFKENQCVSLSSQSFSVKFILLENLTAKFKYPCIMDLKMGTREFGDDASIKKRYLTEVRTASTTSKTLGLRHGGMQVYHCNSGHFVCHNKKYGKTLSVEGFKQTLRDFLYNGHSIRIDVIPPLVNRLETLYAVVKELDTFRFFSCSLLVLYEGKEEFGSTSSESEKESSIISDSLRNKCSSLKDTEKNIEVQNSKHDRNRRAPQVDVRLIDFAHSTHCKLPGNETLHQGPDEGLLFGLVNLISELKIIEREFS